MMRNLLLTLFAAWLLPVLTGCAGVDTLRLVQDRPADLELLLDQHEYTRARQLTGKYPSLDTLQMQVDITLRESVYVNTTYADARTLAADNNLLGAVVLLSDALQRVPHNTLLRELRNELEQERLHQLKLNERTQLVAHASYIIDQRKLYLQQINLEQPSLEQRWEYTRNKKAAISLSRQLLEHGKYAMQQDDLDSAQTCLGLSSALHATPETGTLLAELQATRNSQRRVAQQEADIRQVRKQQKIEHKQQQQTEVLLAETQQALKQNDLQVARTAFGQIPPSASEHIEVRAVQENLDQAVNTQVATLMATGDAQYRADRVTDAIRTWEEAQSLDPDNPELKERIDRANKVLARLEELKGRQHR